MKQEKREERGRMRRKIKRRVSFSGIRIGYTLIFGRGKRLPAIRLRASGRVSVKRAAIEAIPFERAAIIRLFRKMVNGRVTPCGLADVYEDFVNEMNYKDTECKQNCI
jgi:cell division protein FtsB